MTCQVVVMGVSGTGKTVVGRALADELEAEFVEGDAHHPQANVDKMASGHPLDDEDRRPWLIELAQILNDYRARGVGIVLACSALKRAYRDILRGSGGLPGTIFVHIDLPFGLLHRRMEARDHFMPAALLQSQFDALEPLGFDELGIVLSTDEPVDDEARRAARAVRALRMGS